MAIDQSLLSASNLFSSGKKKRTPSLMPKAQMKAAPVEAAPVIEAMEEEFIETQTFTQEEEVVVAAPIQREERIERVQTQTKKAKSH